MKVTYLLVVSADGKTTLGSTPGAGWASPEDQAVLQAQLQSHSCIAMGSATYQAARAIIQPDPAKPRIVLTRKPQIYTSEAQPGLAFTNNQPQKIIEQAKQQGHNSLLLLGGARTAARFFEAKLIDEVMMTIEPMLFGSGKPIVEALASPVALQLLSHKSLNAQGTLLLTYSVQK